jgi:mannobiose 2-epimerase
LTENILPFWRPRLVDHERGGYRLNHDVLGRDLGPSPRHIIAQSRALWFFSRIFSSPWSDPSDLEAAEHGYEFLKTQMWDQEHGGFFWEIASDGERTRPHKHALAQAYGIYALVAYAKATGDRSALELASAAFAVWDDAAYDTEHGGYREMWSREWSPPTGIQGYWAHDPDHKMLDSHLHLTEAFSALYGVEKSERLHGRLCELLQILRYEDESGVGGVARFDREWKPLAKDRVCYGFNLKRIWMVGEACRSAGIDLSAYEDLHAKLLDEAVRFGWDSRDGGFFEAGPPGRAAAELVKPWWSQAEALVCSGEQWKLTCEPAYLALFVRTLEWIVDRQADWIHGDWFENIDYRGRTSGAKAWGWKAPHHNTRAVLRALELLEDVKDPNR